MSYQSSPQGVQFSLDLAKAYPDEAGIDSLKRQINYLAGKQVELMDIFDLKQAGQLAEHFMTVYPCALAKPGQLHIHYQDENKNPKDFILFYDTNKLSAKIEQIALKTEEDQGIIQKWGDRIYRITFAALHPQKKDEIKFLLKAK